jgi:hypothetical protein
MNAVASHDAGFADEINGVQRGKIAAQGLKAATTMSSYCKAVAAP